MTPESRLTVQVVKYLQRLVKHGVPLWYFKVHGGAMQRTGIPDFVGCIAGYFFAIELKASRLADPYAVRPRQKIEITAIQNASGAVRVCITPLQVHGFLTTVSGLDLTPYAPR